MSAREDVIAHAAACREALARGETRPQYAGADLIGANLRSADLSYANLSGANLSIANLSGANLSSANLTDADLTDANLRSADLTDANLRSADLTDADLTDAYLRSAYLTDADLSGAYLRSAYLRGADLTGAIGYVIPVVDPSLAPRALAQIEAHPETHEQSSWHSSCGTKHCAAGWIVTLAGEHGRALERQRGTAQAAASLLGLDVYACKFGAHDDPLPWLRELASRCYHARESEVQS